MLLDAVSRYRDGDREAFGEIAAALDGDVRRFARKYVPGYDQDDVAQEVLIALSNAAERYDAERDVQFRTYFWSHAERTINGLRRSQGFDKRSLNFECASLESMATEDGDSFDVGVLEDGFGWIEASIDLFGGRVLSDDEKRALCLRIAGYTNGEVNEILGGWSSANGSRANKMFSRIKRKAQKVAS